VIDTIKPGILISSPTTGANVSFQVNYSDLNFQGQNLNTTNLTLVTTGTLNGVVLVTGVAVGYVAIQVSSLTGSGSLRVDVAAGTAIDLAGNLANAASTPTVQVETMVMTIIRSGTIRSAIIGQRP
jgi:hypothetical protein